MADVILFGATYVAQCSECFPLVEDVIAEAGRRRFRTLGGAKSFVTRRLRELGLAVATPTDLQRRKRAHNLQRSDGGEAA